MNRKCIFSVLDIIIIFCSITHMISSYESNTFKTKKSQYWLRCNIHYFLELLIANLSIKMGNVILKNTKNRILLREYCRHNVVSRVSEFVKPILIMTCRTWQNTISWAFLESQMKMYTEKKCADRSIYSYTVLL